MKLRRIPQCTLLSLALGAAACTADTTGDTTTSSSSSSGGGGSSSSSGGGGCNVTPPEAWSAPNWTANTTEALALRARLEALAGGSGAMRAAEEGTATATVDSLNAVVEAEDPSLASAVTPAFDPVLTDIIEEFVELAGAGPVASLVDMDGNWAPGTHGGITATQGRGINEGGIEARQFAHKGLFTGGALYSHALSLTTGTIDEATIDSLAVLWGANETLISTDPKTHSANYSNGMGYFGRIADSLIAAKAYAADSACTAERDEALVTFFRDWEESMFARAVYYGNAAIPKTTSTDYDEKMSALHELAEGAGLVLGFRGVTTPATGPLSGGARVATDAEIDSILSALNINRTDLGASTMGDFVEPGSDLQTAVTAVEDVVKTAFDLQDSDIANFRSPTAG